jgi:hypothetical protein
MFVRSCTPFQAAGVAVHGMCPDTKHHVCCLQAALKLEGGFVHAPLSGDTLTSARLTVATWLVREAAKKATAKAKNDLESYIISMREALETDESIMKVRVRIARRSELPGQLPGKTEHSRVSPPLSYEPPVLLMLHRRSPSKSSATSTTRS